MLLVVFFTITVAHQDVLLCFMCTEGVIKMCLHLIAQYK